eukprot:jgi/Chrpa1/25145/Chrysochromulina_OHIO_Genome00025012-RA
MRAALGGDDGGDRTAALPRAGGWSAARNRSSSGIVAENKTKCGGAYEYVGNRTDNWLCVKRSAEIHIYIWLGGWARGSGVVDRCYIDPTFAPSPAAYALFGWALMRHFSADAGTIVRATTLPDPRLTAPAPDKEAKAKATIVYVHDACAIQQCLARNTHQQQRCIDAEINAWKRGSDRVKAVHA